MTNPSADDARPATAGRAPAPDPGQPGPADPAETAAVQAEAAAAQAETAAAEAEGAAARAEAGFAQAPVTAAANGDQPLLRLVGVGKNFGPVRALTEVSLDVPIGQVTALVGDNGAGKSTLVKCVSGIYSIDAGTVTFDGNQVAVHSPRDAS
ncbi:MAG TPA: ATP-binding cassette domain-containing protein, partial [Streptosporangiaceae bacterium]|nr:ATP-binding cassette domain-containing protein [Streptosporangiaceae bacterium]